MQCDCWRPLRLPAILVGDARLGGISTSITAYETLQTRGYDVPVIVLAAGPIAASNSAAIKANTRTDTHVVVLPQPLPALPQSRSIAGLWCCPPACCMQASNHAPKPCMQIQTALCLHCECRLEQCPLPPPCRLTYCLHVL